MAGAIFLSVVCGYALGATSMLLLIALFGPKREGAADAG